MNKKFYLKLVSIILPILLIISNTFAHADTVSTIPSPYELTLLFCKNETGINYNDTRSSINSRSCYHGAKILKINPTVDNDLLMEACLAAEDYPMCLTAAWAYRRAMHGSSTAFRESQQFCATEHHMRTSIRSLNSISCYFGSDFIESNPSANTDIIAKTCSISPEPNLCLQSIWSYKRSERGGPSPKHKNAELYCATITTVVRGDQIIDSSSESTSCYFGIDYIEENQNATASEIEKICRSQPSYDKCMNGIKHYK